jgi:membrane-associated phospholipid phosphatase
MGDAVMRSWGCAAAVLACAFVPSPAAADAPPSSGSGAAARALLASPEPLVAPAASPGLENKHRLEWNERWHRFRLPEYIGTGVTGVAAIAVFAYGTPSDHPKWVGPILFDEPVRDALRLRTRSGIATAETVSSALTIVIPVQSMVDSVLLPGIDGSWDVMWQLGMMDAESYALSALVTAGLYDTTGRARPSYADCKAGRSIDPYCNSGEFASFPSGHTAAAMAGAGLMCAEHGALPLYGGRALDVAACAEGLTLATGVGVLRLMADRHYVSDVLTGGAIGFFSGYGLPMLLHFWKRPVGEVVNRPDLKVALIPGAGATALGVSAVGIF